MYVQAVVNVTRLVGADYASLDVQAVAVFGKADCVDIVAVAVPVQRFEFIDCDIGLKVGAGYYHRRGVEVVGAADDSRGSQR